MINGRQSLPSIVEGSRNTSKVAVTSKTTRNLTAHFGAARFSSLDLTSPRHSDSGQNSEQELDGGQELHDGKELDGMGWRDGTMAGRSWMADRIVRWRAGARCGQELDGG